jgi:outer membrane assembly lipoprotein YfiO
MISRGLFPVVLVVAFGLLDTPAWAQAVTARDCSIAAAHDVVGSTTYCGYTAKEVAQILKEYAAGETAPLGVQIEKLSTRLAVTVGSVRIILHKLGQDNVPEEELPARLAEVAEQVKLAQTLAAAISPPSEGSDGDATTARLLQEARQAQDEGRLTEAKEKFRQVEKLDADRADKANQVANQAGEARDTWKRQVGRTRIELGVSSLNGLQPDEAAGYFSAASDVLAVVDDRDDLARAVILEGYAEYLLNHYPRAIALTEEFIKQNPTHPDLAYAFYLRALCFYEQVPVADINQTAAALQEVINRFPDTAYGHDAILKLDLSRWDAADREMEIGRQFLARHQYTQALGRFMRVIDDYQTTDAVPEALHRLTEIYLLLGRREDARKVATALVCVYPRSQWNDRKYSQLIGTKKDCAVSTPLPRP